MCRDERVIWWQIVAALVLCMLVYWLIGTERIVSSAEIVRDRLFLGVQR